MLIGSFFRIGFIVLFFVVLIFCVIGQPLTDATPAPPFVVFAAMALGAPMRIDEDALVTEVQAAEFLNLSVRTLQSWRQSNSKINFIRCGRAVRYRVRDLRAWIESNTVTSSTTEADAK
jgi:Helix-turn-helix domain